MEEFMRLLANVDSFRIELRERVNVKVVVTEGDVKFISRLYLALELLAAFEMQLCRKMIQTSLSISRARGTVKVTSVVILWSIKRGEDSCNPKSKESQSDRIASVMTTFSLWLHIFHACYAPEYFLCK